jgi:ankyrin repeat protein
MLHALRSLVFHEDGGGAEAAGDAKNGNGMTDILRAAANEIWREVKKLINGEAHLRVADGQGLTALHYAAFFGNMQLARILIEYGPAGLVFCEIPGGETSLHLACLNGHLEVVLVLIQTGGDALLLKTQNGGSSMSRAATGVLRLQRF